MQPDTHHVSNIWHECTFSLQQTDSVYLTADEIIQFVTVLEYLLGGREGDGGMEAGAWWADMNINILRIFRQEVFGLLP